VNASGAATPAFAKRGETELTTAIFEGFAVGGGIVRYRETPPHKFCGDAGHDGAGRDVFRDDGPCSDDRPITNRDAAQHDGGRADPDVIPNVCRLEWFAARKCGWPANDVKAMVAPDELHPGTDESVPA
jgi:hypothetical protein